MLALVDDSEYARLPFSPRRTILEGPDSVSVKGARELRSAVVTWLASAFEAFAHNAIAAERTSDGDDSVIGPHACESEFAVATQSATCRDARLSKAGVALTPKPKRGDRIMPVTPTRMASSDIGHDVCRTSSESEAVATVIPDARCLSMHVIVATSGRVRKKPPTDTVVESSTPPVDALQGAASDTEARALHANALKSLQLPVFCTYAKSNVGVKAVKIRKGATGFTGDSDEIEHAATEDERSSVFSAEGQRASHMCKAVGGSESDTKTGKV